MEYSAYGFDGGRNPLSSIDCEFYSDIRFNLFQSAQTINNRFKYYESIDKLNWLMNCNDLQLQLANVLFKINKRRYLVTYNLQSKLFIRSLFITEYSLSDINLQRTDLFQLKFPLYNRIFT